MEHVNVVLWIGKVLCGVRLLADLNVNLVTESSQGKKPKDDCQPNHVILLKRLREEGKRQNCVSQPRQ